MVRCRLLGLAVVLLAVVVLGGCGAGGERPLSGADVFARACSVCHSLTGAESGRKEGGDLVGYHMDRQSLVEFTREMPVRHRLSPVQLAAVVSYVEAAERAGRR